MELSLQHNYSLLCNNGRKKKYCQKEQHSSKGIYKNLDYQSYGTFTISINQKMNLKVSK